MTTTILPLSTIGHMDRGWTRGHVTASFDDMAGAPGYLALPPLMLAGIQTVDPGAGYPMHHHEAVETITIMMAGTLQHTDSLGGDGLTGPDDVAVVSAGTGMDHEEFATQDAPLRAVVFWVASSEPTAPPRFLRQTFPRRDRTDRLRIIASGRDVDAVPLRADVDILTGVLREGVRVEHELRAGRRAYLLSSDADLQLGERLVRAGDRVIVEGPANVVITALGATEVFLVDLPHGA